MVGYLCRCKGDSMPNEPQRSLPDAYLAESPTEDNSIEIVRRISRDFGLSEAQCRAALIKANVYVAKPKRRDTLDNREMAELAILADGTQLTEHNRYAFVAEQAKRLNTTQSVVEYALKQKGRYPYNAAEQHYQSEAEQDLLERAQKAAAHDHARESAIRGADRTTKFDKPQYHFQDRLNGSAGWFGNPLWLINTIVIIFLLALVVVAIKSIF